MTGLLPNLITLLRIPLGLASAFQIIQENWSLALLLFVLAAFTDYLDGALAKLFDQKSELGEKILEPLSDATMIIAPLAALNYLFRFLNWRLAIPLTILMLAIYTTTKIWKDLNLEGILMPLFSIAYGITTVSISFTLANHISLTTKWFVVLFFSMAAWLKRERIRELLFPASAQQAPKESKR